MRKSSAQGFTLIELLVVIAIIGVLATVVLASLNVARSKGKDGTIISNINNMRAQAELYYDTNSLSYGSLCGNTTIANASTSVGGAGGVFQCQSSATQFRMSSVLSTGQYYCIDNNGKAGRSSSTPSGTQCP